MKIFKAFLDDPAPKNWTVYKLSLPVYILSKGGSHYGKVQVHRSADYRYFEEARAGRKGVGSLQGR